MKVYISSKDIDFASQPKELVIYCDKELNKTLDLAKSNIIDIDDNVDKLKIVCKSYFRKNSVSKLIFFFLSIFSMIFGTNGSEILDYIFDDVIELNSLKGDIYLKYASKNNYPFSVEKGIGTIIANYRSVERKVFNTWILLVIIPIEVILFTVVTILMLAAKLIWFNFILIVILFGFEIFIFTKVKQAYLFIK